MFRRIRRAAARRLHRGVLWSLDEPRAGQVVASEWRLVRGWAAVPSGAEIERPVLRHGEARVAMTVEHRPDVEALHPERRIIGFRAPLRLHSFETDVECSVRVTVRGREYTYPLRCSSVADLPARREGIPFEWCLDSPRDGPEPTYHSVVVRGWVVLPREATLGGVFVDCGQRVPLTPEDRPDVEALYPGDQVVGFRKLVALSPLTRDEQWSLGITVDEHDYCELIPISVRASDRDDLFRRKAAKLERIERILRCPRPLEERSGRRSCGGTLERAGAAALACTQCSRQYQVTDRNFNFLSGELREISGIADTANVSSLPYGDWELPALIEAYADGLILDCGSGLRDVYYENVVNFEIADYLTTDVLGVGEYLPFADDAFDAVISIAVLEHVRNPFACAAEIARVVRPGGKIFVEVPFLQPYHGYPHHYYNMTRSGLENLFSEHFIVERSGLPPGGEPIWTLPWLLNAYIAGLPAEAAEHFKQLTVRDLLVEASTYLGEDFVRELDESTAKDLAHVTYLIATKR